MEQRTLWPVRRPSRSQRHTRRELNPDDALPHICATYDPRLEVLPIPKDQQTLLPQLQKVLQQLLPSISFDVIP